MRHNLYLSQGGCVFFRICLFISRIMQKLRDRFSQNFMERWYTWTVAETVWSWW